MELFINSFGSSLSRKNGMFEAYFADSQTTKSVSTDFLEVIFISKGVSISSDALLLAMEHEIEVIFIDKNGDTICRLWNSRFGSVATIRRNQMRFAESREAISWAAQNLSRKIQAQINQITLFFYQGIYDKPTLRDKALSQIQLLEYQKKKLDFLPRNIKTKPWKEEIMGIEGYAAAVYFKAVTLALPSQYYFEERSRRPALDLFNCALNYLYGILYARVEGALIRAGLDPALGILHADGYNRPALVYDFIEPYRFWADQTLIFLCQDEKLLSTHCDKKDNGFWLNTEGKKLILPPFTNFLNEIIEIDQNRLTRHNHLKADASGFAQMLLNKKSFV